MIKDTDSVSFRVQNSTTKELDNLEPYEDEFYQQRMMSDALDEVQRPLDVVDRVPRTWRQRR